MPFLLNSHNVFNYLVDRNLGNNCEEALIKIERVAAKNFNLLGTFPDSRKLLIKQERYNPSGQAPGELFGEWRIKRFSRDFQN